MNIDIDNLNPDELEHLVNTGQLSSAASRPIADIAPSVPPITTLRKPPEPTRVDGFDIRDPVELLTLLDDNVRDGIVKLHPWQIQFMLDFAGRDYTDNDPFQSLVRACNGSGKDKYIIAPCVVWLCMAYIKARGVVTSSSGKQLDSQTCTYIDMLCNAANTKISPGIWKINYRYYECLATGSPIECFATDEPGKAEGFHPLEFGRKMGLFMSEAKTVPDEVNTAFNKCTGYTHRAHVSTPGLPLGHFFEYCARSPYRKSITDLTQVDPIDYIQYHVTAYECSHLSRVYIEQMKRDLPGGENGAAFKSQVMAEFGTTDEMVVIPYTYIWQAVNQHVVGHLAERFNTGGLDLSAGGDETCLTVRNGNKVLVIIPFRFDNTVSTKTFLKAQFVKWGLNHPDSLIFADAGGLGKPILDDLREEGWTNIRYVLNQAKAYDERVYKNRGAEMWFNFGKLLETKELWLLKDDKTIQQLGSRYYKITEGNKHQLESKLQARAHGHPSPDRADSVVLAFSNYKSKLEQPEYVAPYDQPEPPKRIPAFSVRSWASQGDDKKRLLNPSASLNFQYLREEIKILNEQRKQTTESK